MAELIDSLKSLRVLPVLVVNTEEEAVAVAGALFAGGLQAVEITLRTPAALAAIRAVRQSHPAMTVAAGTVKTTADMEAVGGMALLKALASPFADIGFCPTGGIGPQNFREYLALPNVLCVGGSWMLTPELIKQRKWDEIEKLARQCT